MLWHIRHDAPIPVDANGPLTAISYAHAIAIDRVRVSVHIEAKIKQWIKVMARLAAALAILWLVVTAPAQAQTCGAATSAGTANNGWDTFCWLDMSTYNDVTARTALGQNMSFTLSDGSTFSFNVKTTSVVTATGLPAASGANAVASPSWTGSAVGNVAFLGIPGKPVLYTANNATTVTVTFSNMQVTSPSGGTGAFMFIAADGESSNNAESLAYTTNGGNWQLLDNVPPISGNIYPTYTISGQSANVTGVAGTVGGQVFGSISPTTVTATMVAGGLQGMMFAVRFASIRLNKVVASSRLAAADQFTYAISNTGSGTALSTRTSSGTGNGPFINAAVSLASGISVTLAESMAAGSASALAQYRSSLTCTNTNPGSTTPLPNGVITTSYVFGSVQFGDAISCTFTNTPQPRLTLTKTLTGNRINATDQFTMQIKNGAAVTGSTTTTGTGSTVTAGTVGPLQVVAGTPYTLTELPAGTTNVALYAGTLSCANSWTAATTTLPTTVGGTIVPTWGDNVTCTLANTPNATKVILGVTKVSTVISDPVNGTTNPKLIPGAVVQYVITVTNSGPGTVDASSLVITDPIPANVFPFVQGTAVTFADGTPASGLSYAYPSNVSWTRTAGGTSGFGVTPTPDANGFDSTITGIRIAPTGTMSAATLTSQPSFSISFRAQIR